MGIMLIEALEMVSGQTAKGHYGLSNRFLFCGVFFNLN